MKHKASILAVTLITLSIVLITALSISLVAIKQRNASLGSGKSSQAFQNADTGVEEVMKKIMNNTSGKVGTVFSSTCTGSNPNRRIDVGNGYSVELKDNTGSTIDCLDNTVDIAKISSIKSTGKGANQESRAIEAAVAAGLDWQSVSSFNNSWVNFGGLYNDAEYALDNGKGIVYLRGLVKNGNDGTAIFQLPANFRPASQLLFSGMSHNGTSYSASRVDITTAGDVLFYWGGTAAWSGTPRWVSLYGISFSIN